MRFHNFRCRLSGRLLAFQLSVALGTLFFSMTSDIRITTVICHILTINLGFIIMQTQIFRSYRAVLLLLYGCPGLLKGAESTSP